MVRATPYGKIRWICRAGHLLLVLLLEPKRSKLAGGLREIAQPLALVGSHRKWPAVGSR